jgi:hypothetical protein
LCKISVSHRLDEPTGTPVSLVIRVHSDVTASTTDNTQVYISVREWEKEQYIIICCNKNQFGKHSKLLISEANTKVFNFNNHFSMFLKGNKQVPCLGKRQSN